MLVGPSTSPRYHYDHGFTAGVHHGRVEGESAMALMSRAEVDDSFRQGFAEGARLGYVNGYMQGSGDCAAAVVAHENGTPDAAPAPFANLRTHLDLLTSVASRPALPPPPPRPLLEPPAAACARADAFARAEHAARFDALARADACARVDAIARHDAVARADAFARHDAAARADAFARVDAAARADAFARVDAAARADAAATAAAARADAAAAAATARARASILDRDAATPPSSVLRSRYSPYGAPRY